MSLDVDLIAKVPVKKHGTGVFFRDNGKTRELSIDEVKEKFPNAEVEESEYEDDVVFSANITHNLGDMADEAGIYEAVWRPHRLHPEYDIPDDNTMETTEREWEFEDNVTIKAKDIIPILDEGLSKMIKNPDHYKQFNPPNGWGDYETFVDWVADYLSACKKNPEAIIKTDR